MKKSQNNKSKLARIAGVAAVAVLGIASPASARTSRQTVHTAPAFKHESALPQYRLYNSTVDPRAATDYDSGDYPFSSGDMGGIGR